MSIIKVENLSKKYLISHESQERYTAMRDVIAHKVKKIFSFPKSLQAPKVTKEEFYALKDINFEIEQGDRVGIIGRNGAGKSTLLKVLSRITEPSTGKITISGRVASLLEVGTGFHPELTGRENVFLNGAILGMTRAEIRKHFDAIVDFAEVEKFLDTPVKRYSSGMYVRLAFAVAAHLEPEILIVDEVLAVGDAQFQKKCLGKMQDVSRNEGRTVLFVSHNMGVIVQLCQKAVLLKNGMLITADETKKVIDQYMLNTGEISNTYNINGARRDKAIVFVKIESLDIYGNTCEDFQFEERVSLRVYMEVKSYVPSAKISVTLQNNHGEFLSTFVENLSDVYNKNGTTCFVIKFPAKVIAPNTYAFRLAVFSPNGEVYDLVEMICPVRIVDTGSKMALFEGLNYGSFFLDYTIEK